ncbi:MAG: GGDEF domain-containing protein [Lachnospiraceae bacterium]|nr:GGDEF domain-containing protein [Lachnospiraceae bacterium]
MNGGNFNIITAIETLFTSNISLFCIGFIATFLNFEFLKKNPSKMKKCGWLETILCGVLNGIIIVFTIAEIGLVSPAWLMVLYPLIMVWEISFFSEDNSSTYYRMYLKYLFNFSCIYWFVTNLSGMLTVRYMNSVMSFSLAMLTVSAWSLYLSKSKRFSMNKFKMLLHEKAAGKIFFNYVTICNAFLVFFTWNYKVFSLDASVSVEMKRIFCGEMFLKIAFIWWSSRLLFEMISNQLSYVKNEIYTEKVLEKERSFRNTVMKKGILSFDVDITEDEIREGNEHLNKEIRKEVNGYFGMISSILKWGIHPEDKEEFSRTNSIDIIKERVDTIPYYSHQVRIAPKEMLRHFKLSQELMDRYVNTDKEWVWLKIDYIYTREMTTGDLNAYVAVFDVDLQVEQGEQLRKSATTDFLTGVYNRATIEKKVNEQLEKKVAGGAFLLIDVDNFKSVNDVLGHPVGDELLKQIAGILKDFFRKEDYIGRLGGDEFCVFMKNVSDREVIKEKVNGLNARCRLVYCGSNGEEVKVSVSIGVAVCDRQIDEYKKLYTCADMALYETKKRGKDTNTVYSEEKER